MNMKIVKSKIVPLNRSDVDTDLIIPAEYLTTTVKVGLGKYLFARLKEMDEYFPFNLEKYRDAQILVAGRNFGCGSSREHAAWALSDAGIRVVVSSMFADIFYNNALKNGILPLVVEEKIIDEIFEREVVDGGYEMTVDLERQILILADGRMVAFEIDPYRRECLMLGMDDMDYLAANFEKIETYYIERKKNLFFDLNKI